MGNAEFVVIYNSREDNTPYVGYCEARGRNELIQDNHKSIYKLFIIPMSYEDIDILTRLSGPDLAHKLVDLFHEHAQKVIYTN